jgi:hypothetical protein
MWLRLTPYVHKVLGIISVDSDKILHLVERCILLILKILLLEIMTLLIPVIKCSYIYSPQRVTVIKFIYFML